MKACAWKEAISQNRLHDRFALLYGKGAQAQKTRYLSALDAFSALYGEREILLFSVPGRIEVSGNHTDHNGGAVLAASVDADMIAVVSPRDDLTIRLYSEGFGEQVVDLSRELLPSEADYFTTLSLIRGCADGMKKEGYDLCGFDAYLTSDVPKGSGLSSSAAFEVLLCKIISTLSGERDADGVTLAEVSQYAERVFFGKPCGLMDQVACAVGGMVGIDFSAQKPIVERVSFAGEDYAICVTDTGGNHADLNEDYAAVPREMKAVAAYFGQDLLCRLTKKEILSAIPELRAVAGDRAILRALHFFEENERVKKQITALKNQDYPIFLAGVRESGKSSFCYLQNVYAAQSPREQGISLALKVSEMLLEGNKGVVRVHGGGFAGTVLAFVKKEFALQYENEMNRVFGQGACRLMQIRCVGAWCLEEI